MIFCLIYVQLFRKCIFLQNGNLDVFTYPVTKELRGASSTRLRRQSSLDQWMIPNVMKFILFRPLNKTAKERGSSLSNVCSVFVRWRGGQINVLSVHSRPQCSLSQWKITLALLRTCSEVHSSSYVQCEQCWDLAWPKLSLLWQLILMEKSQGPPSHSWVHTTQLTQFVWG